MAMSYRDTPARPWQRLTLAAISLVALISIAGCTNKHASANGVDAAAPPMAVPVTALSCQSPPDTTPGRLPDHVWIAVAVCPVTIVQFIPGGVAPSLTPQLPRLLHGDLRPLVAALNRPDA